MGSQSLLYDVGLTVKVLLALALTPLAAVLLANLARIVVQNVRATVLVVLVVVGVLLVGTGFVMGQTRGSLGIPGPCPDPGLCKKPPVKRTSTRGHQTKRRGGYLPGSVKSTNPALRAAVQAMRALRVLPPSTDCATVVRLVHQGRAGQEHERWDVHLSVSPTGRGAPFVRGQLLRWYCKSRVRTECHEVWVDAVVTHGLLVRTETGCN